MAVENEQIKKYLEEEQKKTVYYEEVLVNTLAEN